MKVLGMTGGIGMGKSTAGDLFRRRGVPVIDTDILARDLVEPGQPALLQIERRFGPAALNPDGTLNREEMARIVFGDPKAREDLEGILHPPIREAWQNQVKVWEREGHPVCVVTIPLLFETKAESQFSAVICVACSEATQQIRMGQRGWAPEQSRRRIEAQMPVSKKITLSDFLVWTDVPVEIHAAQLERILEKC